MHHICIKSHLYASEAISKLLNGWKSLAEHVYKLFNARTFAVRRSEKLVECRYFSEEPQNNALSRRSGRTQSFCFFFLGGGGQVKNSKGLVTSFNFVSWGKFERYSLHHICEKLILMSWNRFHRLLKLMGWALGGTLLLSVARDCKEVPMIKCACTVLNSPKMWIWRPIYCLRGVSQFMISAPLRPPNWGIEEAWVW